MIEIDNAARRGSFYQWDLNQRLVFDDVPEKTQVHFSSPNDEQEALVVLTYSEDGKVYANVPNILLQIPGSITVYVYQLNEGRKYTQLKKTFNVLQREKPEDYVYTETELEDYKRISEQYEANIHYEQTVKDAIDILTPLAENLPYMTHIKRTLIYDLSFEDEHVDIDSNAILFNADLSGYSIDELMNEFEFIIDFNMDAGKSYGRVLFNTIKFELEGRGDYDYSSNTKFEQFFTHLSFTNSFLHANFFRNNSITMDESRLAYVPCRVEIDLSSLLNNKFMALYILDDTVFDAIADSCVNDEGNVDSWYTIKLKIYRTERYTCNDISDALDILNGEVI